MDDKEKNPSKDGLIIEELCIHSNANCHDMKLNHVLYASILDESKFTIMSASPYPTKTIFSDNIKVDKIITEEIL